MLVIRAGLKLIKKMDGLKKVAGGCATTRWRLPGNKFGLVMRMTNDR